MLDGLFGCWFGDNSWTIASWTLSVELWSSFFVYLLAQTVVNYEHRWHIYALICIAIWIPRITDEYKYTDYHIDDNATLIHMPFFVIGMALADVENLQG